MHSPLLSPPKILDIPRPSHNSELHGHSPTPLPTPFVSAPSSPRLDLLDNSDFDFSARFSDAGAPSASFMPPMSTADELFLNGKIRPLNGCAAASGAADCSCRWSSDGAPPEERKTEAFGCGDGAAERRRWRQGAEEIGGCAPVTPPCCYCCCHSYCHDVRQAAMSASRRLHYHHRCEMMMMMMTSMMRANSDVLCNLQLLDDDDADPCCAMNGNHHRRRHDHHHHSSCGVTAPQSGMLLRPHQGDGDSTSSNFSLREFRHGYGDEMHRWHQVCSHGHRDDEKKNEDGDGDGDSLLKKKKKAAARIHGQEKKSAPLYAEIKSLAADFRCCPATLGGGGAAAAARRRRSGCSPPPASHRRTRSLSPLRVFHMDDLVIMAPPRPSFESHLSYASASEWSAAAQAQERCKLKPHRRRTLKEFLSVGGNNRVHECERGRAGGEDAGGYGGKKLLQLRQQQKKGNHNNRRCAQREEWQSSKSSVGMRNKPSCAHHQTQNQTQQHHHSHSHGHGSASAAFFSGAHHQYASCHKAQAEILKKRTFLPYKHGLLGCLGFTSKSYSSMKGLQVLP